MNVVRCDALPFTNSMSFCRQSSPENRPDLRHADFRKTYASCILASSVEFVGNIVGKTLGSALFRGVFARNYDLAFWYRENFAAFTGSILLVWAGRKSAGGRAKAPEAGRSPANDHENRLK